MLLLNNIKEFANELLYSVQVFLIKIRKACDTLHNRIAYIKKKESKAFLNYQFSGYFVKLWAEECQNDCKPEETRQDRNAQNSKHIAYQTTVTNRKVCLAFFLHYTRFFIETKNGYFGFRWQHIHFLDFTRRHGKLIGELNLTFSGYFLISYW